MVISYEPRFTYCCTQPFTTESFSERKGLLSCMLARKRTRCWGLQSKPPEVGLSGQNKHAHHPGVDSALLSLSLGKIGVGCFERIYINYGLGQEKKVKLRKFWGQWSIRWSITEEVFNASGLVVDNSVESSWLSKMWWHLVVNHSF